MSILKFPLNVANGHLTITETLEEEIESQILLCLHTVRGELVWNTRVGIPFYLFQTAKTIQKDIAQLELALTSAIPSTIFQVEGNLDEDGLVYLQINWQTLGGANGNLSLNFEIG